MVRVDPDTNRLLDFMAAPGGAEYKERSTICVSPKTLLKRAGLFCEAGRPLFHRGGHVILALLSEPFAACRRAAYALHVAGKGDGNLRVAAARHPQGTGADDGAVVKAPRQGRRQAAHDTYFGGGGPDCGGGPDFDSLTPLPLPLLSHRAST